MKKKTLLFYSLTLLALCGLTFSSCGGDDPDPPVVIKPVITLDSEIANFTYIGGEKTFEVKVDQPDVKWTAKESEDWVKITNETATGFTIEIPQWNETGVDPRKATVTVSAGTADPKVINITQTPADAPEPYFDVDDEDIEFAQQGGSETVEVDANVSWEVKSEDSWITISEKTDGSFKVTTQPNNTSRLLEGTITVSCGMEEFEDVTIKVTQDFTPAELSIDLEELEQAFSYKENSFSFTVDSNVEYTVTPTITADEEGVNDWLTITNDGDEYTVTIDRNFTSDGDRTAKITVAANEEDIVSPIVIDVTQRKVEWKAGLFFPNGNEDEIPAAGGSARFPSISYNDPDETVCDADWVTVTHQSPNMYVLIASAEANTTGETREAKIYVYSDFGEESVGRTILTVTQEVMPPEPGFGSDIQSILGRYHITGIIADGSEFFIDDTAIEIGNFADGISAGWGTHGKITNLYSYNPCYIRIDPANGLFLDTSLPTSTFMGSPSRIACFYLNENGSKHHDLGMGIEIYAVVDRENETFTFEQDFVWTTGMEDELKDYDGQPLRIGFGTYRSWGDDKNIQTHTNAIAHLKFTRVE